MFWIGFGITMYASFVSLVLAFIHGGTRLDDEFDESPETAFRDWTERPPRPRERLRLVEKAEP